MRGGGRRVERFSCGAQGGGGVESQAMRVEPADSRAFRREMTTGCAAMLVAVLAALVLTVWVFVSFIWPDKEWWGIPTALQLLFWFTMAGIGAAIGLVKLMERSHYRLGVYRCWRCNRALRGLGVPCVCGPKKPRLRPRPWLRHHRKRVPRVLLIYACLLPVAVVLTAVRKPGAMPLATWQQVVVWHGLLSVFLLAALRVGAEVADALKLGGRRFRVRMDVFILTFGVWPLAVVGLICLWL